MLGLVVLICLGCWGAGLVRLSWKHFAIIGGVVMCLVPIEILLKTAALERMGESAALYWRFDALALSWLSGFVISSTAFLIGFGISRWLSRSK